MAVPVGRSSSGADLRVALALDIEAGRYTEFSDATALKLPIERQAMSSSEISPNQSPLIPSLPRLLLENLRSTRAPSCCKASRLLNAPKTRTTFWDGNGHLARLVMNAELFAVGACRIIVPTLFREEYLDSLRALSRQSDATPFMAACNAFERSPVQFRLLTPTGA